MINSLLRPIPKMSGICLVSDRKTRREDLLKPCGCLTRDLFNRQTATTVKDDDAVVFTKTSLIQFLKSHDIQVDTNYSELKGLPR